MCIAVHAFCSLFGKRCTLIGQVLITYLKCPRTFFPLSVIAKRFAGDEVEFSCCPIILMLFSQKPTKKVNVILERSLGLSWMIMSVSILLYQNLQIIFHQWHVKFWFKSISTQWDIRLILRMTFSRY